MTEREVVFSARADRKGGKRTVRHRAALGAGATMTELSGLAPVLAAVRIDACQGGVRDMRNTAARKVLATRAIHRQKCACKRPPSSTVKIGFATGQSHPP